MNHIVVGLLVLLLGRSVIASEGQDEPLAPAARYQALLDEYRRAANTGALSDAERLVFVGRVFRLRSSLAQKFVELADEHPEDPIAVDALIQAIWQVNTTPWPVELVGRDDALARAFAILQRDHIHSDTLGPICERLSWGFCQEYETFLRAVLLRNPHHDVQGQACLALAHFLSNRVQRLDLIGEQPDLAREFSDLYGKEYLNTVQLQDRTKANEEIEALFERAVEEYGEVRVAQRGTVGERAKAELFEMRHLAVGKKAPDIEGQDQHGERFRLGDYHGKVVLLYFWSQY